MKRLCILLCVLALSSCAAITLMKSGTVEVGDAYAFETSQDWNRLQNGHIYVLTLDGFSLQIVEVSAGTKGEKKLLNAPAGTPQPKFEKSMTLLDMQDFVKDSFIAAGAERFEYERFGPSDFGTWPGFRATFSFFTKDGLKKRGLIAGAIHEETLYTIMYAAAALHYYDATLPEVERMIESVRPVPAPTS